jgi:hypothetical protein
MGQYATTPFLHYTFVTFGQVILLEKAWAKSHGNYDRIIGGTSSNTMRDLTGAPAYSLKTNQAGLWETILASDRATHCMAAGGNDRIWYPCPARLIVFNPRHRRNGVG